MKNDQPHNWLLTGNQRDHTTTYKPITTSPPQERIGLLSIQHATLVLQYTSGTRHRSSPQASLLWASARTPGLPMSAIAVLVQLQPHLPDCAHQGMFNQCIGINPPQQELGSRSNPLQVTLQPGRNLLHRLAFGRVTELDMQSFSVKT